MHCLFYIAKFNRKWGNDKMKGKHAVILLVEDDEAHAMLIIRTLEDAKVANKICWVDDGEEALDYLFHHGECTKIIEVTGDWIYLEEKKFGSEEGARYEQWIIIKEPLIEPGENIIVFENANPVKSGYWVLWNSLRLEVVKGHRVWELGTNDGLPDEFWNPWQCK